MVYKIPKGMQNKTPRHYIYIKSTEIIANRQQRQKSTENRKGTESN